VFRRRASVRLSGCFGRYSSAIKAARANERSCGSARGGASDGRSYHDQLTPRTETVPRYERNVGSQQSCVGWPHW